MNEPKRTSAARPSSQLSRRRFLFTGLSGLAGLSLPAAFSKPGIAIESGNTGRSLIVEKIDRVTLRVPYREVPKRAMGKELPHWRYSEVFEVHLKSGHAGFGETMLYYTWGITNDEDIARALGKNAASLMWDDSLGAGLQMALFDAVAKTAEVPIHALLGQQVHEKTPLSWWNIDTSAADMASECREAHRLGYMAYKTKGRPWFDVYEQLAQATKVVPESFKIDMDFNDTLRDADRAIPILKELEKYPHVDIYETPIPQGMIADNQRIRAATRVNIAMHYGSPSPSVALKEEVCDGFVIGGGATRVTQQAHVAAMADKPFWLQLTGTGITAAFSLHFGAVSSHARWPAVNCHQLYTHTLLTEPIPVVDGFADVPDEPGLGYELDRDAIERFRVEKPKERPDPPRLLETTWSSGRKMYIANNGEVNFLLNAANRGKIPFYEPGADTKLVPNDGSQDWRDLYTKARSEPVFVDA